MATSKLSLVYRGYGPTQGSVSFHGTLLTAGNFTTQMGLADDLVSAIAAVTTMVLLSDTRLASVEGFSPITPADPYAIKTIKWLIRARDTNGNAVVATIPGADPTVTDILNGNVMDLTSTEGAALVNALEAYMKSNDGEAVTVEEIVYIQD